eukprot:CAMPEP_0201533644 /NCGR_PEP_ID=MMETSP0161_2-20130828/53850_1 /ASSEMBLY_ACC=CAM_ASM_000251 /TAXON_ID=180227 /ORGANISM="Neoparamoeba aestuarina, Strain SoJaBio B1-5/56/2" /LENGTH=66 /DNA_ID=CAMNT_0047937779 /DNA_START=410 /DNA_END=610 /DNA_ORIENTATION=-
MKSRAFLKVGGGELRDCWSVFWSGRLGKGDIFLLLFWGEEKRRGEEGEEGAAAEKEGEEEGETGVE